MNLIILIVLIFLCGLAVWFIENRTQIPRGFKTLIYVVLMVACILWALAAFGVRLPGLDIQTPQVR